MVYNRVNWETGDVMTKEKMNRSEAQLSILTASDEIFKEAMMTFRPYESSDLGADRTLAWGNGDMSNANGSSFNQDTTCIIQTVWSSNTFPKFIKIADGYRVKIGMRSGDDNTSFEGILQSDGTLAKGSSATDPTVDYYHTGIVSLAHINATNTWDIRFVIKNINDDTVITPAEGINLLVGEPVDVIGKFNKLDTTIYNDSVSKSDITWEQGSINSADGNPYSSSNQYHLMSIRTNKFKKDNILSIKPASGYKIKITAYNGSTYVGNWDGTAFSTVATYLDSEVFMADMPDNYLYRISLRYTSNIGPSYSSNCIFTYPNFALSSEVNTYNCKDLFIYGYYNTSGTTIGSYTTSASYVTCILRVTSCEKLYVTGIGGTNARVWAFADKDKKITRAASANAFAYNTALTVETGEEFFIYNTDTASTVYPPYLFIETDRAKNLDTLRANVSDLYTLLGCEEISYNFEGYYSTKDIGGSPIDFITSLNSDAAWQGVIIACQPGDIFTINAYGGATARAWAFLDGSKIVIANEPNGAIKIINGVITAPENSAYLIIQNRKTGFSDAKSYKGCYIDKTLTLSNKAADAKVVGDRMSELENALDTTSVTWALNGINVSTGANTTATNRVSSDLVTNCPSIVRIVEGYSYMILRYTKNGTYDGAFDGSEWSKSYKAAMWRTTVLTIDELGSNAGNYNYRVAMKANDDANLTIADAEHITLLAFTDSTLTMAGKAADAKAAGDAITEINSTVARKAWDIGSYNLLDKSTATFGIMTKVGTITPSSGWRYSDFIPVEPGMVLYAGQYSPSNFALYDSNKNLVTNNTNWSNPFTVPENVHYIIMTFSQADPDIPYVSTKNAYDEYKTIAAYIHDLDSSIGTINANIDDINTDVQYVGLSSPYNITWELGKNINNATTGDVVASPYTALSNILPPSPIVIRTGADTDSSDIALSMFVYEFDSNNVGLGRTKLSATDGKIMRTSSNCAYIRIVFGRPQSTGISITQSDIDNYFGVDVLTSMREVADGFTKHQGIYDEKLKYVALGSSTTEGTYSQINIRNSVGVTQYGFPYWIAKENNYELANLGHGGGGWLNHGNRDNNNVLSLIDNILKAQTFDDSATYSLGQCSIQNGDIYRYAKNINGTSVWTPLLLGPIVSSTEEAFSNKNIITISYGTNDFKAQWKNSDTNVQQWYLGSINQRWRNPNDARIVTLGDSTYGYTSDLDSKLTVIGAMSIALENLAVLAPNAQIIVILPGNFKKLGTVSSATPTSDEIEIVSETSGNITTYYAYGKEANNYGCGTHNHEGKTLADYRAAIKECAEYYGVRVVDMGICAANRINMNQLLGDGIHPTLAYYKQIGYTLAPLIR